MIKIIEESNKEFIARCPRCGGKFSYELSDLQLFGLMMEGIHCPRCEHTVFHKLIEEGDTE